VRADKAVTQFDLLALLWMAAGLIGCLTAQLRQTLTELDL